MKKWLSILLALTMTLLMLAGAASAELAEIAMVELTDEQLQALLDAALQSPTARNTQQWHFSVVQNRALLDEFFAERRSE